MSNMTYKSAREAAQAIALLAIQWKLFFGDLCSAEELLTFADCLDKDNPLPESGGGYVAGDNGDLGITLDGGQHVEWLATVSVGLPAEERLSITETPGMVVKDEISSTIKGIRQLFTLKGIKQRLLITGAFMLVMWIGLFVWQYILWDKGEETPFVVELLSYLTFTNGGLSTNALYIIGGSIGKMFVLGTLFAFVLGGFRKVGRGIKAFFPCLPHLSDKRCLGDFLAGMGVACVLYNFFTGEATLSLSMVGVAGVLAMLWALGGGVNFTHRIVVALTAFVNRDTKVHYADTHRANCALSGLATGFLISIPLSSIPWGFTPYVCGGAALLGALCLRFVAGKPIATAMAVLAAVLLWPAAAHASGWWLEYDYSAEYKDGNFDWSYYEVAIVREGHHEIQEYDLYDYVDDVHYTHDPLIFTSTEPPRTIRQGDVVTLNLTCHGEERAAFSFNADIESLKPAPSFARCLKIGDFVDENGKAIRPGSGMRQVSYRFDEDFLVDVTGEELEAPDGALFVVSFISDIAESRWVYKYHRGEKTATPAGPSDREMLGFSTFDDDGKRRDDGPTGDDDSRRSKKSSDDDDDDDYESSDSRNRTADDDKPELPTGIIPPALILILVIAGAGEGGAEGYPGDAPTGKRPSDPYVKRDKEGNIHVKNPLTGETDVLPPDADEQAKREEIERILRNPEYYEDAYRKHLAGIEKARKDVADEAERRKDERKRYEERLKHEKEMQQKKDALRERLMEKFNVADDKWLRRALKEEMGLGEADFYKNMAEAHNQESYYQMAKLTKDSCDTIMDVIACTSPAAAKWRDIYKAATEVSSSLADAGVRGTSMSDALSAGISRAAITYLEYQTSGAVHAATTIVGEGARDYVTALQEGKSPAEASREFYKGMTRGIENATVDLVTGALTDSATEFVNTEAFAKMVNSEATQKILQNESIQQLLQNKDLQRFLPKGEDLLRAIEQVGAAADDIGKIAGDSALGF